VEPNRLSTKPQKHVAKTHFFSVTSFRAAQGTTVLPVSTLKAVRLRLGIALTRGALPRRGGFQRRGFSVERGLPPRARRHGCSDRNRAIGARVTFTYQPSTPPPPIANAEFNEATVAQLQVKRLLPGPAAAASSALIGIPGFKHGSRLRRVGRAGGEVADRDRRAAP